MDIEKVRWLTDLNKKPPQIKWERRMNSRHYQRKPKTKQFERKKVFKGVTGAPITWEFVDKEEEPKALTAWQRVKKWFLELPIWSIK